MSQTDYIFKIVLTGSGGVGKTALSRQFFEENFRTDLTQTTLRVAVFTKKIQVNGKIVRLVSLDTAGQEYYGQLRTGYYRGAKGALLIFDLTQLRTLEVLDRWLRELKDNAPDDISIILVGNKSDLKMDEQIIPKSLIEDFKYNNHLAFYETSAKDGTNVKELFYELSWRILEPNISHWSSETHFDHPLFKTSNLDSLKIIKTKFCPLCGNQNLITGQRQTEKWVICFICMNRVRNCSSNVIQI